MKKKIKNPCLDGGGGQNTKHGEIHVFYFFFFDAFPQTVEIKMQPLVSLYDVMYEAGRVNDTDPHVTPPDGHVPG